MSKGAKIRSLQVGYSIIEAIARHGEPMKFNEILNVTNTSNGNLYKYLNTLTSLGLLKRQYNTGHYFLGSQFIEFGMIALNSEDVIEQAWPHLQEINKKTKETTILTVWTHKGPMIIKMINSTMGLNLGGQVGTYLPLHSATGKMFAAFRNDLEVKEWKEEEMKMMDEIPRERIDEEIDDIRAKNISFAKEALVPSIHSCAVPILNYNKKLLGVVTVLGFTNGVPNNKDYGISQYLLEKSREISAVFGGRIIN